MRHLVESMKPAAIVLLITAIITAMLALGSYLDQQSYDQTTRELCEPYKNIPESHVDRVPDGCITQYYEGRRK